MTTRAIQRHTGVSKISNVTSCCGSFFSNGVSATSWCAFGIIATLSAETSQTCRPGLQLHSLQLQFQRLPIDVERSEPVECRREAVRLISLRIAAERGDIERRIVEQVFQLARQFRTIFGSIRRRHAPQIEIMKRFRIVARVASFQKLEDRLLRCAPAQRILCFRNGRLRA